MGLLDKLKAAKNVLTGGAAKVYLEAEPLSFVGPFKVRIRAQTGDAPVKIDRVYLQIRGKEYVKVPDVDVTYDSDGESRTRSETVSATNETLEFEKVVANGQELAANESFEWEIDIDMPTHAQPIFKGRYTSHYYEAFAGLDCFGNDPDSGWVRLSE